MSSEKQELTVVNDDPEKTVKTCPVAELPVLPQALNDAEEDYPEGGRGWLVVAGCFLQASVTLGQPRPCNPLAWGVFQAYYKNHQFPEASETVLSMLGASNGAVMPITSFIFGKLEDRYGYRPFVILGSVISFIQWFSSAWCTQLWQFFLTQGLLQGLANGILFPTVAAYPSQWFYHRRSFATGIAIAGSSFGGGTTAILLRIMLSRLGLRKTFLVYSFINCTVLFFAYFLLKDRPRRHSKPVTDIHWIDTSLFGSPVFWSMVFCLGVTVFGYQTPYFFVSVFTSEKNPELSSFVSTVPILMMNYSAALGRTLVGFVADKMGPCNTFALSILISGLTQVLIWNFASSLASIMVFAVTYGFWGGVVVSLLPPAGAALFGAEQLASLSGLLTLSNLPGYTAGPTLGGVVLAGSGHNWHAVALYSGGMQLLGVVLFLYGMTLDLYVT
ncbi:MFS general substrate transporter [Clavulina sp. PMI_390]|nr:MFS general substrate transporter [Clavulina sp. PMI_390]